MNIAVSYDYYIPKYSSYFEIMLAFFVQKRGGLIKVNKN